MEGFSYDWLYLLPATPKFSPVSFPWCDYIISHIENYVNIFFKIFSKILFLGFFD